MRGGERTAHFSSLPLGQGWEGLAEIDWGRGRGGRLRKGWTSTQQGQTHWKD